MSPTGPRTGSRDTAEDGGRSPRAFEVGVDLAGTRLDRVLAALLDASRRHVRELLARGAVSLNGRRAELADKGDPVSAGDRLLVQEILPPALAKVIPEPDLPLCVLARGPGWLAIDKPAGVAVHPLREGETGTVLNALVARHPEVQGVGEAGLRSGVVHRLDVETSGVLLLATTARAWERLRGAFREHRVSKVYRAIVQGELTSECRVELGLAVAQHRPARVRVVAAGSEPDRPGVWRVDQWVRPLEALRGATLVEVRPRTGFLHQIRATLAHLGHPVVGDAVYDGRGSRVGVPGLPADGPTRHMLHSAVAVVGDDIRAEAPDPADFAEMLLQLRGDVASGTRGSNSR